MLKVEVLERSKFTPKGGKVVYKLPSGEVFEEETPRVEELGLELPFEFLNPVQAVFFRYYEGGNALVAAPTSAGKTGIALLFFRNRTGRLVYTAPTKALVSEKAKELRRIFGKVDVRTGDVIEEFKPVSSRVVVSTYENFALSLRNRAPWTEEVEAVVVDEVHAILGSRGQVVEEVIAELLDRKIDLLTLSATVPGAEKLADWIDANLFIRSRWRPVPLERRVIPLKKFKEWINPKELGDLKSDDRMALKLMGALFELVSRDEKAIVFVPKKSVGWKMLELANRERLEITNRTAPFEIERFGYEIAFHNADIPKEEREEIEKAFREGELNILIATQTLAYGVNLPADKVLIGVKGFFDRFERKFVVIPDPLDILQEEGRAGRFGIKEKGFSYILPYGGSAERVKRAVEDALEDEFKPYISQNLGSPSEMDERAFSSLSLFLLVAVSHKGGRFKEFLRASFSLREHADSPAVSEAVDWLKLHGYISEDYKPTEKGLFCLRSGVPPLNFEEFLRRKELPLPTVAVIRPLLYTKRFDGLKFFFERFERFEKDMEAVSDRLIVCGNACFEDNTDSLLFFAEGFPFYYPNVSNPPGEFSYLGSDALHLLRTLIELRRLGFFELSNGEMLRIAHSLKYGLTEDFSPLGGIKGIGHIRSNLLKEVLLAEGVSRLEFTDRVSKVLETFEGEGQLAELLEFFLAERRKLEGGRLKREVRTLLGLLRRNSQTLMVDDKILYTFGLFLFGRNSLGWRREKLLERILEG